MRMFLIPPPHTEGYASYLAAMDEQRQLRHLSCSNLWTIWMRKKTRTMRTMRISKIWMRGHEDDLDEDYDDEDEDEDETTRKMKMRMGESGR